MAESRAKSTPSARAVCGSRNYSYEELLERAEDLSRLLASSGQPGRLLALDIRSPACAAIAILAAAHMGCAVLPLNADNPQRYQDYIMSDAGPAGVIYENASEIIELEFREFPEYAEIRSSESPPDIRDIAYVMYTSGSTGRPKGVIVSHDALLGRLAGLAVTPGFNHLDSFLAMSTISFDISLAELLLPLYTGGTFIAAPLGTRLDPAIFARAVDQFSPSVIQATPSFWRLALTWGWAGNPNSRIWCGGESLTPALARSLLVRCAELWNVYGPTETTLWSTAGQVTSAEVIGLGRPLPGTGIFLEDASGLLSIAPGAQGEILLYGVGMANGYINQPELTAERFCERLTPAGRALCYRTGDLAVCRNDGTLQFLGRIDSQVKLRGHRIELGEVEAVIEEHPSVRESVAVLRDGENPARARIAVFVVTDGTVGERDIRSWLSYRLPVGMRPGEILLRAALPRTPSGKIDRLAVLGESA